jgi:hypothetical protein
VELDRAHLDTGDDAGRILDIEIIFGVAVLLADRHGVDMLAEAAGIMLLEEAVLGATLGAATRLIGRRAVQASRGAARSA